jgi:hypothetical protein
VEFRVVAQHRDAIAKSELAQESFPSATIPARTEAMAARAAIFLSRSKGFAGIGFTAETGLPCPSAPFCRLCLFPT